MILHALRRDAEVVAASALKALESVEHREQRNGKLGHLGTNDHFGLGKRKCDAYSMKGRRLDLYI